LHVNGNARVGARIAKFSALDPAALRSMRAEAVLAQDQLFFAYLVLIALALGFFSCR